MGKTNELHRIQQSFRSVLEAMSRPGKVTGIQNPPDDRYEQMRVSASLGTLIDMFIDQSVRFSVFGDDLEFLENAIIRKTNSSADTAESAAFLIGTTNDTKALKTAFEKASGGSLDSPHNGATFLIECNRLFSDEEKALEGKAENDALYWISVEGPGIEERHVFGVSDHEWIWSREKRQDEYPCGVEIILTDCNGRVVAIPRSSFVSLLVKEGDEQSWVM
ncbi:MAG: phosphonate C-P lyase system protein PhnH [Raoultibacter sp.]|jgi:alpha-D-ribose 1-methylphosphonate 5-triphosphate synthase subunit PhnH